MRRSRRLALFVSLHTSFGRRILEGVVSYCERERETWQLLTSDWGDLGIEEVEAGAVEGMLGFITDPAWLARVRQHELPCVNLADHPVGRELPSVLYDAVATGQVAARHLRERRVRTLGLVARRGEPASDIILRAMQKDGPVSRHETRLRWVGRRHQEKEALCRWLAGLPKPAGVFAVDDILARRVLYACARMRLEVPEEVAVLGSGDYELVNRLALVPLSSVIQSSFEIGYQAMGLLDRWLAGERPPSGPVLVPPTGIVARRSTDTLAVDDPTVVQAVEFIRANLQRGLRVQHLAEHAAVSRRWLERRFADVLGRSPAAEIRRAQVELACQLLTDTDWSLAVIARECGLRAPERLSVLFKREVGMTPGRYRSAVHGQANTAP